MKVVFDATILLALLQPDSLPPRHPDTNEPVDSVRERIDYLIRRLEEEGAKIVIPTPALSEVLVRADGAVPRYLQEISSASVFRSAPFDERCAVELAAMTRSAIDSGDKKGGQDTTWAKVKFDRQIVAIAKVEGVSTLYSDDKGIETLAADNELTVIKLPNFPCLRLHPNMKWIWRPKRLKTMVSNRHRPVIIGVAMIAAIAVPSRLAFARHGS